MPALAPQLIQNAGGDRAEAAKPVLAELIERIIKLGADATQGQINILVDACHEAASDVQAGDTAEDVWNKVVAKLEPAEAAWARQLAADVLNFIGSAIKAIASIFGL
jgi:hypothetical protein